LSRSGAACSAWSLLLPEDTQRQGRPSIVDRGKPRCLRAWNAWGKRSCVFHGAALRNGATVMAFERMEIGSSEACRSEIRHCRRGILSGSFVEPKCNAWKDCRTCIGEGNCCGIDRGSGWRRPDGHCVGTNTVDKECGVDRGRCEWVGCRPRPGWRRKQQG
jgi:hypothetical protein